MRKIAVLFGLFLVTLLAPSLLEAAVIITPPGVTCAADTRLTAPVIGQDVCFQSTTRSWLRYTAVGWVSPSANELLNVRDFGAIGDGAADDTTAIQGAITAAQAVGGIVFLPPGRYKITSALSITGGMSLVGSGAQSIHDTHSAVSSATVLFTTSTTINLISVNTTQAVHFHDFTLVGSTSASAGAGITVTGGTVDGISGNQRSTFARITFQGLFYGIQLVSAVFANIEACVFENYQQAGIDIQNTGNQDNGDNILVGNTLSGGTTGTITGVRWASGGGLHMHANKMLGNAYGIDITQNQTGATSDFLIVGNSIENFGLIGIRVQSLSTGTLQNFIVAGNQILASVASSKALQLAAAAGAVLNTIAIQGNSLTGAGTAVAVEIGVRVDNFTITGNTLLGFGTGLSFNTVNGGLASGNRFSTVGTPYNFTAAAAVTINEPAAIFASATLPAVADGSTAFCTNCNPASACTAGGAGAFASRQGGAWKCL